MANMNLSGYVPAQQRLWIRLALGLLSGLAIVALGKSALQQTAPMAFFTMLAVILFVPTLVIGALGQMRLAPMLIWSGIAAAFVAALAFYDAGRLMEIEYTSGAPKPTLTPAFVLATPAALYIAHHLIAAADRDRRLIAKYDTYFDIGWTSLVQILLAGGLCFALALVLFLARGLFDMIGLKAIGEFLFNEWVFLPLMGATFAAGIHLSDVRAALSRGIRTLVLTLLGWLFPVMAGLALLFVISVGFTGVAPIFDTGFAAGLLLTAAFAVTILMNAAYQDGGEDRATGPIFTTARYAGCVALFIVVCIAMIAIGLRINQYGLTPERIFVSVALSLASLYAAGYLIGLLPRVGGVKRIEHTNLVGALAILAAFIALFSPIADPARLSVQSQVKRLDAKLITPGEFDFTFLKSETGRYGRAALQRLAKADDAEVARLADLYMRNEQPAAGAAGLTFEQRVTPYPQGKTLPASMIAAIAAPATSGDTNGSPLRYLECVDVANLRCNAHMIDLDGDGKDEVIFEDVGVADEKRDFYPGRRLPVLSESPQGWRPIGNIGPFCREAQLEALKRGEVKKIAPRHVDLEVVGARLELQTSGEDGPSCPP